MLTSASGAPVTVVAAIVFVDLQAITLKATPDDVHVTTRRRVLEWLTDLPTVLDPAQVDHIFRQGRYPSTWTANAGRTSGSC